MKLKETLAIAAASLILFSPFAKANSDQDFCSTVPGNWKGVGYVSKDKLKCSYSGVAVVAATSDPGQFTMKISLKKVSGPCPASEDLDLPGTCQNNTIAVKNDEANLSGSLSNSGKSADMKGTINIPIGGTVITTNVDSMHLDKQ